MNVYIIMFLLIMLMVSVTFLTLLEQKLLSYIQIRKGPNKVGYLGIFQPFSDAVKLFFKENTIPIYSNYFYYFLSPIGSLLISLMIWCSYPFFFNMFSFNLLMLYIFSCMSVGVYFMMISGWSSNSMYSLLGSLRSIAQTISYEVCMIFFFIFFMILIMSLNIIIFFSYQQYISFLMINIMMSFIMFIIFLSETNRAPFDFAEGESELVSGFNTEYSGGGFILIFLSEYMMIMFLSLLYSIMFMFNSFFYFILFIKMMFMTFLFIWVRGSYPRFRFDKLMNMSWKYYLSISLIMLMMLIFIKLIIYLFSKQIL